jgi:release factor glutamine methyltransferase
LNYSNNTEAVCTDISEDALQVAKENAGRLSLSERALFVKTDLFPEKTEESAKFDLIVSNPPYIRSEVIETLAPEVKDYEPRLALDGDEDGLVFYRRIVDEAPKYLFSNGYLIMEIGYDQAEDVVKLLENAGSYHDIEVIKDYAGNDRVVRACYY